VAGYIEPLPSDHEGGYEFVDDIVAAPFRVSSSRPANKGFKEAI